MGAEESSAWVGKRCADGTGAAPPLPNPPLAMNRASEYNQHMSYTDIQAQAALLPLAERIELTRYLTALETEDELRVLLSQRMRAMDTGRSVSLDAFKQKHEQLEAEEL